MLQNSLKMNEQKVLEEEIIRHQQAYLDNDTYLINKTYQEICLLYPPLRFMNVWYKKYNHLFESKEDFTQEYLRIFCKSLIAWKPRTSRRQSKFGGSGDFKNFFWSAISNNYINMIKAGSAAKRNQEQQCPICLKWVTPLAKHLLNDHTYLLWDKLSQMDLKIDTIKNCPFCKSYNAPKVTVCTHGFSDCYECHKELYKNKLCKHISSMHSAFLFEHFHNLYPDYLTLSDKPVSIYSEDDEGESRNIYDTLSADSRLESLMSLKLSDIQKHIIEKILNGHKFKYTQSLFKCPREKYEEELEDLKNKMSICGLE